jgi:hypothetical protein
MATTVLTIIALMAFVALAVLWVHWQRAARAKYIRTYVFPVGLYEKLRKKQPHLSLKDCQLVGRALRQFFLTYLESGFGYVSMPSQVVDDLWHELILYTRQYEFFCKRAFGRFLHHTPAVTLSARRRSNEGLRRCWWHACVEENIDPRKPTRLPLLFAIDAKLDIADGFRYSADCNSLRQRLEDGDGRGVTHCGGDFSSTEFDGTTDGLGDTSGGDGADASGGGCGGGCSGD